MLSENGVAKLEKRLTDRALELDAPKADGEMQKLFLDAIKEEAPHTYVSQQNIDPKTLKSYLDKMDAKGVENADVKNPSRSKAFKDIRTPMSLVDVLESLQGQVLDLDRNFFSSDDVAIYANDTDKPTVIATRRAIDILKEHNLAPSTTESLDQKRVITFNCTISGEFQLVCTVIKFADRNFLEFKENPRVYRLNEEGLYVMLHHPSLDDTLLNALMYKLCITCTNCVLSRKLRSISKEQAGKLQSG